MPPTAPAASPPRAAATIPAASDAEPVLDSRLEHLIAKAFLGNSPDVIFFKDIESRFLAVSRSFKTKTGLPTFQEILGKTDAVLFGEHARQALADERQVIATGEPMINKLEREDWSDGRVTWAVTTKMPLRDETGAIIGTFGFSKDVTAQRAAEEALERAQKELLDASRQAGMAEVATGVLHNVGNALTSINVSTGILSERLAVSKIGHIEKVAALLEAQPDLGAFFAQDPRGHQLPGYLRTLAAHLAEERAQLRQEVARLQQSVDHVKDIVNVQQTYATKIGLLEPLFATELVDDALRMNTAALSRHDVTPVRDFTSTPKVLVERAKVLQILINLIRNAKYAMDEAAPPEKRLTLRVCPDGAERVRIEVRDNGVGIPAENLTRIFSHGFTTRSDGHGFGLHSSALAAQSMGGSLHAESPGLGGGATFVLTLPVAPAAPATT